MKKILLLLLIAFMASSAIAETITATQAQALAGNFLSKNSKKARGGSANLSLVYTDQTASQVNYYAFNATSGEGFVIVSGDDQLPSILGYSDEGYFDINDIPENMKAWLDDYAEQIKYLQANPSWKASSTVGSSHAGNIYPLLGAIQWGQSDPYNLKCPTYVNKGVTTRCATGCVATAMAQVMRYHKWPETGTGSSSYVCAVNGDTAQKVTLTANYGATTYAWANMLPYYDSNATDAQKDAVATLMSHCGISTQMSYGPSSGTPMRLVLGALGEYFKYDKGMQFKMRDAYTLTAWSDMLDKELAAGRPVLYGGTNGKSGGHAFVIDGSNSSGYYHLNWGWYGHSNGYFALTGFYPKQQGIGSNSGGGYNFAQSMIIGIQPDKGNEKAYSVHALKFTCQNSAVKKGENITFVLNGLSAVSTTTNTSINAAMGLFDSNGKFKNLWRVEINPLPQKNYSQRFRFPLPTLAAGTYYLRPLYRPSDKTQWNYIDLARTTTQAFFLTVDSAGTATVTSRNYVSTLHVDTISVVTPTVEAKKGMLVKVTVTNKGEEYFGNSFVAIADAQNHAKSLSASKAINVAKGETVTFEMALTAPDEGNYTIKVLDNDTTLINGATLPVTVVASTGNYNLDIYKALSMPSTKVKTTHLEAEATIYNYGGTFNGQIEAMITDPATKSIISRVYSDYVSIKGGSSKQIKFNSQFTGGVVGKEYRITLRNPLYTDSNMGWGQPVVFTVIAPVKGDVNCDGVVNVSDVTTLVNGIFGTIASPYDQNEADVNGDGKVDVSDVTALMKTIL